METQGSYDHLFKLLIVGDSGVGKSSILLRFTDDRFEDDKLSTIGVDLKVRMMDVDRDGAKKRLKVTIWDTAGQERFRTLTSSYYRGSHGCILVYDVTREATFKSLQHWVDEIDKNTGGDANIVKVLVGNKIDDPSARQVSRREGETWAQEHGMIFIESSAKTKQGIKEVFLECINQILDRPSLYAEPATRGTTQSPAGGARGGRVDLGGGENNPSGSNTCC